MKFVLSGISRLLIGEKKELKKLLRNDQNSLGRALRNSIKKCDLLMVRCLIEEFKVDVTQLVNLGDEKSTTFVLLAMEAEFQR